MSDINSKYPLALPEGSVLAGQYVINKVLGQGGFGITYKATDHKTGEFVAVKEFFPDTMATRTQSTVTPFTGELGESFLYGKECFLKEAETLAQFIGNPNIVRIFSYFEENGTAYFVMEYIEGTSFDVYIKEHGGKISWKETAKILIPIMDALGAVHSKGIVHRDVTPDNIYITSDGTVKLLDFGAARYSLGDKSRSLDVVLKHGFAPKEQYTRRGKQGPFTDIYALGATFYFALTGKRPPDSIDRLDDDELVLPSVLGVKISHEAEEAILMAMNVQPADRFQTMAAFKNAMLISVADTPDDEVTSFNTDIQQPNNTVEQRFFTETSEVLNSVSDNIQTIQYNQNPNLTQNIPAQSYPGPSSGIQQNTENTETKKKKWLIPVIAASLGVVVLIVILVFALGSGNSSSSDSSQRTSSKEKDDDDKKDSDSVKDTDSKDSKGKDSGNSDPDDDIVIPQTTKAPSSTMDLLPSPTPISNDKLPSPTPVSDEKLNPSTDYTQYLSSITGVYINNALNASYHDRNGMYYYNTNNDGSKACYCSPNIEGNYIILCGGNQKGITQYIKSGNALTDEKHFLQDYNFWDFVLSNKYIFAYEGDEKYLYCFNKNDCSFVGKKYFPNNSEYTLSSDGVVVYLKTTDNTQSLYGLLGGDLEGKILGESKIIDCVSGYKLSRSRLLTDESDNIFIINYLDDYKQYYIRKYNSTSQNFNDKDWFINADDTYIIQWNVYNNNIYYIIRKYSTDTYSINRLDYSTGKINTIYTCPEGTSFAYGLAILDSGQIAFSYTDSNNVKHFAAMNSDGSNVNIN